MDVIRLKAWLGFNRLGLSPIKQTAVLNFYPSPSEFLTEKSDRLRQAGFSERVIDSCRQYQQHEAGSWIMNGIANDLNWLELNSNHHILTLESDDYPELLKQIPDPPPVLFIKGHPEHLHRNQIGIVGSRHASAIGLKNADTFARELSRSNWLICSGLAIGIDGAAHSGCAESGYPSIGVLGCSVDQVYPKRHRILFQQMSQCGAIVSEFPIGTAALARNFPRRNRIISGLSRGILVIEAAPGSGSLITADQAMEQGREVFAIPGNIHNPQSQGCNQLIQQGAKLVSSVEDILVEFGQTIQAAKAEKPAISDDPILNAVDYEITSLDLIIARTQLSVAELSEKLLTLELEGLILQSPGGYLRL
ncbi:DNA-processing protein DprA [Gynuella sp.]|uniref:DNA-processing protein DprA n=1 Tax=Gynuella sp. TaxID=2969146 RepID=UPI003D128E4E